MHEKIWLSSPHMGGSEMKYVEEAYHSNWVAPLGNNVDEFERNITSYTGIEYCTALSSGTAAIHLALILCGVTRGDIVLCQSMTFAATVNPVKYLGATPVFIDSEKDTWNMSPELLEEAIVDCLNGNLTSPDSSKTYPARLPKAIIPVHLYGMPSKIDKIIRIADKYGIPVVEDAAESLGSSFCSKKTGTFGAFGILSFNGNKIITTSGGGALISSNKDHILKAHYLATQAREDTEHYEHRSVGYNYRMSNILAGIGRGQFEVLDKHIEKRRSINRWYKSAFESSEGIMFQNEPCSKFYSNYWLTALVISPSRSRFTNNDLRIEFARKNIESRPLWKPMHLQPVFKDCPAYVNGISESFFRDGICLPSGSNMSSEQLNRIGNVIKSLIKR